MGRRYRSTFATSRHNPNQRLHSLLMNRCAPRYRLVERILWSDRESIVMPLSEIVAFFFIVWLNYCLSQFCYRNVAAYLLASIDFRNICAKFTTPVMFFKSHRHIHLHANWPCLQWCWYLWNCRYLTTQSCIVVPRTSRNQLNHHWMEVRDKPEHWKKCAGSNSWMPLNILFKVTILIRISLAFVAMGPINNMSVLVPVISRRWTGDKPSS